MEEGLPTYQVFINHRGPDVKKTLASLIYFALDTHGLRVFLDERELQVGNHLTHAFQSAIRSASVHIAILSKTYAESPWCLNELLWMFNDDPASSKIIPIFYDIEPWELRYVEKGAYAEAFQEHRNKGRVTIELVDSWISALNKVSGISGVVINTKKDNQGEYLKKIVEIVLEKVGRVPLHVCDHPVGLVQAAERFEKEVLNPSELRDIDVVGIVGLAGSGKSTLVTHLYNSKRSQFHRSCFLSDVSKNNLPSLQETLFRDLLYQNLHIQNARQGKSLLQDRLRGLTRVLIVFDDIDNTDQVDNLLFVKDVVGNGSLILVTARDKALLLSSIDNKDQVKIYNIKLLEAKDARELFCWHAFRHTKPLHDLQDIVEELVRMCGGFPLALRILAGHLHNVRDPTRWKKRLEGLRKQLELQKDVLKQILIDSYESLDDREKEAFLDAAHFFVGEDTELVERVLDGLNDNGFQCLETLHHKCLVEFESADIIRRRAIRVESLNWSIGVCRRTNGSFKIRMHDLVRELARQMGREKLPLRLCCSNDKMISTPDFDSHGSVQKYDVRGIRRDEDHDLPVFLQNQDICGVKLLSVQNPSILQKFNSVSGDLTWFRWRQSEDTLNPSPLLQSSFNNLFLRNLIVLEAHGVSPPDFRNFVDDRESPSQLVAWEVTGTGDFGSGNRAGPSTAVSPKKRHKSSDSSTGDFGSGKRAGPSTAVSPEKRHKSSDSSTGDFGSGKRAGPSTAVSPKKRHKSSDSSQPPINLGQWIQGWLQNIQGVNKLPIKFEEVRNLRHLDLSGCSDLEVLPDSFTEELLQLQYLALRGCRKLVLQDLGKISKLEYLDLEGCSMLREMPKGTEVQKSLKYLNVVHTKLRKLPQYLEQLEYLEELHIGSSELTEIPSSLCNLCRLTHLTLLGCTKLLFINSIEKLVHLESFRLYNCGVRALPERIAWMNLKYFDVQGCPLDFKQVSTGVDSGNIPLDSSQGSIDQGAHPNRLSCLTDLIIRGSNILGINIPQAESFLTKLETVDLSNNRLLTEIGSLPCSLISLNLMNCSKLRTLKCLSNLARLKVLNISRCDELESLDVEGLSSIEVIKADACGMLWRIQGLKRLEKLSNFQISVNFFVDFCCKHKQGVRPYLGRLTALEELESCRQTSLKIEKCHFTDVKSEGSILLYLITEQKCKIEVAFLDYACTSSSPNWTTDSPNNFLAHILMWRKDSEVFNDIKSSNDEAIHFNIKIEPLDSTQSPRILQGWMIEDKDGLSSEMNSFLSYAISFGSSHSIQRGRRESCKDG